MTLETHEALNNVQPDVAMHFDEIRKIPRAPGNESGVREYLDGWAKKLGLKDDQIKVDEAGNIAISFPATPGYEDARPIIIQSHMDMVSDYDEGKKNPAKEGVDLLEGDGWLTADGTTLGADNGIGLATSLAVVEEILNKGEPHPEIIIMATTSEEAGMIGAENMNKDLIPDNSVILNTDSEEGVGEITVGTAGGEITRGVWESIKDEREQVSDDYNVLKISIDGLPGGHSGMSAGKGLPNALKILASMLESLNESDSVEDLKLIEFGNVKLGDAPNMSNIPKSAEALIAVPNSLKAEELNSLIDEYLKVLKTSEGINLSLGTDNGQRVNIVLVEDEERYALADETRQQLIGFVSSISDSASFEEKFDDVYLSSTLVSVSTNDDGVNLITHSRVAESRRPELDELVSVIRAKLAENGAKELEPMSYPGWEEDSDVSIAVQAALRAHKDIFPNNEPPVLRKYHAGLELSTLQEKAQGVSAMSAGPLIEDVHTVSERANIKSINEYYEFLLAIVQELSSRP